MAGIGRSEPDDSSEVRVKTRRVVLLYALFASLWILTSGLWLKINVADPALRQWIEIGKGLGFVAVTSILLYWLLRSFYPRSVEIPSTEDGTTHARERKSPLLLLAILLAIVPLVSQVIIHFYRPVVQRQAFADLVNISRIKADGVRRFIEAKVDDGELIAGNITLAEHVYAWRQGDAQQASYVRQRLNSRLQIFNYAAAYVLDPDGNLLLAAGDAVSVPAATLKVLPQVLNQGTVRLVGPYMGSNDKVRLQVLVPLQLQVRGERQVAGIVVLEIDPNRFLYPYIQDWPARSPSGEVLLVRRDRDSVEFLNELRFKLDSALRLQAPLSSRHLVAAIALRGNSSGTATGVDYRGIPVFGAFTPVPGTAWFVIAKVDQDEVFAPLEQLVFGISIVTLVAVAVVFAALLLAWRQQRRAQARELYVQEMAVRMESEERFRAIAESAEDAIVTMDERGMITGWNPGAERLLGYDREGAVGKPMTLILAPQYRDVLHQDLQAAAKSSERKPGCRLVELEAQDRDGQLIPVEVSLAEWKLRGRSYYTGIMRDIRERREAMATIRRQKDLYALLSNTNKLVVRTRNRDNLFRDVCRIAVGMEEFQFASVRLVDGDPLQLRTVAWYGDDPGQLKDVLVMASVEQDWANNPVARAFRFRRGDCNNDLAAETGPAEWGQAVRLSGFRSVGAFPICRNQAVIGTFDLYAGEPGRFTDEVIATLQEMSDDISFALDNLERVHRLRVADDVVVSSPTVLFRWSLEDGRPVEYVSENVGQWGYQVSELVSGKILYRNIIYPTDLDRVLQEEDQMVKSGGSRLRQEYRIRTRDGLVLWVEDLTRITRDADGRVLYLEGLVTNIDARKQAELARGEAEHRFQALVEQNLVGIIMVDDRKILYANPRGAGIFGYEPQEVQGREFQAFVSSIDGSAVARQMEGLLSGTTLTAEIEFNGIHKDGREVLVGAKGIRATVDGKSIIIGVLQDITEKRRAEDEIRQYMRRLESAMVGTVNAISQMVELRDPYTAGHERRVGELSAAIAAEMGLDENIQHGMRIAGSVHDVGKIMVPAEILSKPGRLGRAEMNLVREHAQQGFEILKDIDFPWPVAEVARSHHERLDGSGYPRGLKGDEIILEARILAVADVMESMSSHRPYRPGLGVDKALEEIAGGRGTLYDAEVADACHRLFRERGYAIPD